MSRQFWSFLAVGLVVVALAVAVIWSGTKGAHLTLEGKFLNVRTVALGGGQEMVIVDFRVTNPSNVPFDVSDISLRLERHGKDPLTGLGVSRSDVDTMFQTHPLLGARDNDVLAPPDTIAPGKSLYRMAEASFEASPEEVAARQNLVLHIEDVDGAAFDLAEKELTPDQTPAPGKNRTQ